MKQAIQSMACLLGMMAASGASAQAFPNKTITVMQGYGAGASLDVAVRAILPKLAERLGVSIIAENRPGADGVIATQAMLKMPPDGYTMLGSISTMTVIPTSKKGQLPYDPLKDLQALTRYAGLQSIIAANPKLPANTLAELIAYSKANPGKVNYATTSSGGYNHLLGELLKRVTGLNMTNVPYKTSTQAQVDVINGSVELIVISPPSVLQHIQAGKMKSIVIASARRFPGMPDLPSVADTIPSFGQEDVDGWGGFMVRAGTPRDIVMKLHSEIVATLKLPEMQQAIVKMGFLPVFDETPEAYQKKYLNEITIWERVVREGNIKFD